MLSHRRFLLLVVVPPSKDPLRRPHRSGVAEVLSNILKQPVAFADDCVGTVAEAAIKALKMAICCCLKIRVIIWAMKRMTLSSPSSLPRLAIALFSMPLLSRTVRRRHKARLSVFALPMQAA